jgi:hypothetical protein
MKRSKAQREQDLACVKRLLGQGRTQAEIAAEIGISLQQASRYARAVLQRLRNEQQGDLARVVAVRVAQLKEVQREAWVGWEMSKQDSVRVYCRHFHDGRIRITTITETRHGDPAFLRLILRCIEEEAMLLYLFPSQTYRHTRRPPSWSEVGNEL